MLFGADAGGWAALVERLRNFSIAAIGLEASGGYERGVARALLAAGMSVRQVNPFKRQRHNTPVPAGSFGAAEHGQASYGPELYSA